MSQKCRFLPQLRVLAHPFWKAEQAEVAKDGLFPHFWGSSLRGWRCRLLFENTGEVLEYRTFNKWFCIVFFNARSVYLRLPPLYRCYFDFRSVHKPRVNFKSRTFVVLHAVGVWAQPQWSRRLKPLITALPLSPPSPPPPPVLCLPVERAAVN